MKSRPGDTSFSVASRRQQARGVALISVLLIVALVSALAYHMVTRHSLTVAHSRQILYGAQARQYALGGEAFARQILFDDWNTEETQEIDSLLEDWSLPLTPFEIDDGVLEVQIRDLERLFNLNSVTGEGGPDNMERLKRLLTSLGAEQNLADAWLDWVDDDVDVHDFGAEDSEYLLLAPAYRSANQPARHVSELLAISGMTSEVYELLKRHVTLLPSDELKVNMNTAGTTILEILSPNFSQGDAQALVESEREYTDVESITAEYASLGDSVGIMAVNSEYFEVSVRAEVSGARSELTSLIHRDPTTGKLTLLQRNFGQRFESIFELDVEDENG